MEWLIGILLTEAILIGAGIVILGAILLFVIFSKKPKRHKESKIKLKFLNEEYRDLAYDMNKFVTDKEEKTSGITKKAILKKGKKKVSEKKPGSKKDKRVYILKFDGGLFADETAKMREEITAVLLIADPDRDEVVIELNSPGGTVNGYGFAADQLRRIRNKGMKLTVLVDQVAASGGYMMACVADEIVASPFAYIGSVGVVSEFPNYSKLMKKVGVEWKSYTAGNSKRDVGTYKEPTKADEKRHTKKLNDIHRVFKNHIKENRPKVDVDKIATGEVWTAKEAKDVKLVDKIQASDDYILAQMINGNVYRVYTPTDKSRIDKLLESFEKSGLRLFHKIMEKNRINY